MNDTNERSGASAGSVAGEPVAWAVMVGGQRMYVSWCKEMCEDEAYYHRHPCGDSVSVVPLYRQPPCQDFSRKNLTLTAAERDAIQTAMNAYGSDNANPECAAIEETLWGLLERTK